MVTAAQSFAEPELIQRVRQGQEELFYRLIEPYQRAVYAAAFSVLGNEADAEEVAQEAFLKAYAKLDQFRAECKFSTWLIQITINEARMRRRKDRKSLYESIDQGYQDDSGDYSPRDFADWREIPSEALEQKQLKDTLTAAIASLKPIYREVLVMRDVQGMNIRETAEALGINEPLVRTRLLRARLQLRDALAPGYDGSWTTGSTNYKKVRPF
jgi:RNA polymerase sigma-70 factor (ECF subfamily)